VKKISVLHAWSLESILRSERKNQEEEAEEGGGGLFSLFGSKALCKTSAKELRGLGSAGSGALTK
jgi:hypothetical protein